MSRYCTKCGAVNDEMAQYCTTCQAPLTSVSTGYQPMESVHPGAMTDWKALGADKKITAGICAILVGWLGVHKFILGYTTEGIIQLVLFHQSLHGPSVDLPALERLRYLVVVTGRRGVPVCVRARQERIFPRLYV